MGSEEIQAGGDGLESVDLDSGPCLDWTVCLETE